MAEVDAVFHTAPLVSGAVSAIMTVFVRASRIPFGFTMYAIFEDGSRQYRAEVGATVVIDYREVTPGQTLELTKVLLLQSGADTQIGRPLVEGARIITEVVDLPTKKTMTQKFRRRKNYRRLKGHTQPHVRVKVKHILKAGETAPTT